MFKNMEDFFYAQRGRTLDASVVLSLCGGDPSTYRKALGVARGNNVRISNAFCPRVDSSSDKFSELAREMTLTLHFKR
jgi:hypothetical protein